MTSHDPSARVAPDAVVVRGRCCHPLLSESRSSGDADEATRLDDRRGGRALPHLTGARLSAAGSRMSELAGPPLRTARGRTRHCWLAAAGRRQERRPTVYVDFLDSITTGRNLGDVGGGSPW